MKKLMLACTAALFSVAVYAQERQQDSTRTETNQYRENREQQTKENMDSTSIRQDAAEVRNQGQRELDTLQQDATRMRDTLVEQGNDAGNQIRNEAREMRDSARQDMNQAGDSLRKDAQQTENQIRRGAQETRDNLREGATRTQNEIKEGANEVKQNVNQAGQRMESTDTSNGSSNNDPAMNQNNKNQDQSSSGMSSANSGENGNAMPSELEVVEGKEGPNNELVYKFKGEMWYVDRESKQMVKADESKLKDSKHEVMIHEGSTTNAKNNNNRKKGKS